MDILVLSISYFFDILLHSVDKDGYEYIVQIAQRKLLVMQQYK